MLNLAEKIDDLTTIVDHSSYSSDLQIEQRIVERFDVLETLARGTTTGDIRALIVSGGPGLGKSYTVERVLHEYNPEGDQYQIVKGYTRATGIVKMLYQYRNPGNVIVFDDCDSVFQDDVSLNLLKSVCDTTENRWVSWLSESKLVDGESAEIVPRQFKFEGSIVFITNIDFDGVIARGHKLAPHLEALCSRAHYLDLTLKTKRDYLVRIRHCIEDGLLSNLSIEEQADCLTFIECYSDSMRELSLRAVIKLGNLRQTNGNWHRIARITMLK